MLATDAAALAATARRLRSGILGADHAPWVIANLIEALARERASLQARIEELERALTPGAARNAYAVAFRDVTAQAAEYLDQRGYEDLAEDLIAAIQPDFARAGAVAQESVA